MKLKGLTKLALSGVALAAVAATLGTSTYAWYVSNSTATVNGITGSSSTTPAGSLLLNALDYDSQTGSITAEDAWTNTLSFGTLDSNLVANTELIPTTKDTSTHTPSGTGVTPTGWHDKGLNPSTGTPYGYLMFGAQQSDNTKSKVTMSFGITNTTVTTGENPVVNSQTVYYSNATATPTDAQNAALAAGTTFTEDFVYALKFDVYMIPLASANKSTVLTNINDGAGATLAADSFFGADLANTYVCKTGYYSNGNAHNYYKALSTDDRVANGDGTYGDILGGESVSENTVSSIKLNFANTTPYLIVIRYWLDGADPQCFDSTIKQSFDLKLKMVATAPNTGETGFYNN